jgi:hypothetical protein
MRYMPVLPNPAFIGKTGNGDWADCLAEMDYRTGQILDAIKEAGIEDNTLVIFASDNGPEATDPWEGDSGPWRGTYFTAMEASLRAPFTIRWPGKVPAGRVSNEIVHIVDMYPTLARVGGAQVPTAPSDRRSRSTGLFPRQAGELQPRGLSRLRRRPPLRRQMAQLEDAPHLASEHVRPAYDASTAKDRQPSH